MARKLAAAHGLGDDDVIVARADLEELQSRLYCLEAALEDTDRDVAAMAKAGGDDPAELRQILAWLVENGAAAAAIHLEART